MENKPSRCSIQQMVIVICCCQLIATMVVRLVAIWVSFLP